MAKIIEMTRIRQIESLWVVEVLSPVSGWIVQGEHLTKQAAENDRRNWL